MKHPLIKLTEYLNGISGNIRIWSGQDSASIVPFPFHRYRSLNLNVRRKTPLPRYFAAETTRSFWGLCCVCYRICVHKKLLCFCSDSCRIVFLTMVKEFFYTQRTRRKKIQEREKREKENGRKGKRGERAKRERGKEQKKEARKKEKESGKAGKRKNRARNKKEEKVGGAKRERGKEQKKKVRKKKKGSGKEKKGRRTAKGTKSRKKGRRAAKETKKGKKGEEQSGKNKKSEKRTERRKKEAENRKRTKWKKHKFSSTTRPLPFFPGTKKDRPGSYAPSCLKHIHSFKVSVRRFRRYCRRSVPSRCRKG